MSAKQLERESVRESLQDSHYAVCVCVKANSSAPLCTCKSADPLFIPKDLVSALAAASSRPQVQGDGFDDLSDFSQPPARPESRRPSVDAASLRALVALNRKLDRVYTAEEVAPHNTLDDCWMIIEGNVYNITEYIGHHPGGTRALLKFAGKDGSENVQFHSSKMMRLLKTYFFQGRLFGAQRTSCVIC